MLAALVFGVQVAPDAAARPEGPVILCSEYPTIPVCQGRIASCSACHTSVQPVGWNAFGASLLPHLGQEDFSVALVSALEQVQSEDSDEDGVSNIEELQIGSDPADPDSLWIPPEPVEGTNPNYQVGSYDPIFAFRRVNALYCGRSPTYDQLQAIRELSSDDERRVLIHESLDDCLESDYWRKVALFRLADPWVRPIKVFGPDTDFEPAPGVKAVIGDYFYEYRLFSYAMTNDRDVRELVTAQYHVEEADDGAWFTVEGVIEPTFPGGRGGQPLEPQHRAGLLTAQWMVTTTVMLTAVPRVLTGHIYRTFLGMDISLMQGLAGTQGEPLDIDQRGVRDAECAACHATLDPATYPFARLVGLDGTSIGAPFGTYDPDRLSRMLPSWEDDLPQGVFLGEPVESVVDVGAVIANAPAFHRTLAEMFFEHGVGRPPGPGDFEEFGDLWLELPADGYSINGMLHRLVDSDAFGVP